MRGLLLLIIPLALIASGAAPAANKSKSAKPAASQVKPLVVPKDAVEIGQQTYRYKDAKGKIWIYHRTPFGVTRNEEGAEAQAAPKTPFRANTGNVTPAAPATTVRATDLGDSVRFEHPTPMGVQSWEKKKSDLTAAEKAWLDQSKPEN